jgi:hypothetical protein
MTDLMERTDLDQKAERKRFESIWWAGVLIWIGLALGANQLDILPEIGDRADFWPWIFLGVGPWSLVLNLYRTLSETAPKPSTGDWIWTVVFIAIGFGALVDFAGELVGAVALIALGLIFMSKALRRSE